jgi:hypothetical protein
MVNTVGHRQTELSLMLGTLYTADQAGARSSSSVADPFLGLLDPDPLLRPMDPDPSITMQK